MRVLALDTSTSRLSAALARDGQTVCEINIEVKTGHAGILLAVIDELLGRTSTPRNGLDLIAVGVGPGSFTGLRIGIATAKGLASSLGRPLVGIPSLDAMANGAAPCPLDIVTVVDAKKGEVFCARYNPAGVLLDGPVNIRPEHVGKVGGTDALFLGNACAVYRAVFSAVLGEGYTEAPEHLWHPRASVMAAMAVEKRGWLKGGDVQPVYVRESDAVLSLKTMGGNSDGRP